MKSSIVITHNPSDFMFYTEIRSHTYDDPSTESIEAVKNNSIKNQKQCESLDLAGV